jgi:hypothetical protein
MIARPLAERFSRKQFRNVQADGDGAQGIAQAYQRPVLSLQTEIKEHRGQQAQYRKPDRDGGFGEHTGFVAHAQNDQGSQGPRQR